MVKVTDKAMAFNVVIVMMAFLMFVDLQLD
ncbi:hypothetical protein [Escherichia phage AV101]|nr:hypothetical protein [Escherichia phage AV101]